MCIYTVMFVCTHANHIKTIVVVISGWQLYGFKNFLNTVVQ